MTTLRAAPPVSDWAALTILLQKARARHDARAGTTVQAFMRDVEAGYYSEVDAFIRHYGGDPVLADLLGPLLEDLREYLRWAVWTAWNVANLVELHDDAGARPARRLAGAMLAYAGIRFVDDGLDGHEEYAGRKTLVRLLRDRRPELSPRAACAQVVFWGHCLVAWSVRRQRQNGEIESAELFEDLFSEFSLGMVAESLLDGPVDRRRYDRIASRKTVAYNLMLYKPFLVGVEPRTRAHVLRALARMDWLAQFIDDARDLEEDERDGQLNAFLQGAYDRNGASAEALARVREFLLEAAALPGEVQDALIVMLDNSGVTALAPVALPDS